MRRTTMLLLLALGVSPAAAQDTTATTPAAPTAPTLPAAPAAPPAPAWLPRSGAVLELLDKVAAQRTTMTLRVGQSGQFGSLTVTLRACDVRPPDVPADATAWLDIDDRTQGGPGFHGWLVASAPAVSGLQHPLYGVRLARCT